MMATAQPTSPRDVTKQPREGIKAGSKPKKAFPRPKPNIPKDSKLLQPKFLSPVPIDITYDPLWLDSFDIEGEGGFTNVVKDFKADASGFCDLVEQEYKAISDCDKFFTKSISASAYAYYHHVMWWHKIALIAQKHGCASVDQERLIHFVNGYEVVVGAGAATYLSGMGDYTDGTGVEHYLTASEPNADGGFGELDHNSHRDYETKISPIVSFRRVTADVALTLDRNAGQDWIPNGIIPAVVAEQAASEAVPRRGRRRIVDIPVEGAVDDDIPNGGGPEEEETQEAGAMPIQPRRPVNLPTANLLGWRRATVLNKNQAAEIMQIIEDPNDVEFHIPRYAIHRDIFVLVYRRLRECKRYKVVELPKNTNGSIAQQLAWKPTNPVVDRNEQFISGEGKIISRTWLPVRLVTAARVLCYRAVRAEFEDDDDIEVPIHPWACLYFRNYRDVPNDWSGNRNAYLIQGNLGLYDYTPFESSIEYRGGAVFEFLNKFKTPAE